MIVPQYWAECRLQHREQGRQVTVRRFGWSDVSQTEAEKFARERASDALQRLLSGERLQKREPLRAYNGAEGVPIREEIVDRFGDTIITRNSYGALCLNTPGAFFIDIDYEDGPPFGNVLMVFTIFGIAALVLASRSTWLAGGILLGGILFSYSIAQFLHRQWIRSHGGKEQQHRHSIEQFLSRRRDWSVALYRTPGGLRVLALHRFFDPQEAEVAETFRELDADPVYRRMCLRQNCFRARVSPKPWRVGVDQHLKPRPGVWPIAAERMQDRLEWIEHYETASEGHAACEYLGRLGTGTVHPDVAAVQHVHDDLSLAHSRLPIA